jgi:uncharacterized protein YdbL (DUF1318 family)
MKATIQTLYQTLSERKRPEDVAEMILTLMANALSLEERNILEKAAKGALSKRFSGYTAMLQTFAQTVGAATQISTAIDLFKLENVAQSDYTIAKNIEVFIAQTGVLIHKPLGENNFLADRLNKQGRIAKGLDISKRSYNKKWRLLKKIEEKLLTTVRENRKNEFQMIAKHGLSHHLKFENFATDLNTACFIAYYNARCNLRSTFTNKAQERPFDEICAMLFKRCEGEKSSFFDFLKPKTTNVNTTNWLAIAYLYSDEKVLKHLTDGEKGVLLGEWTSILEDIAALLTEIWTSSTINRKTMVVSRGNDSTTWNNTAGAWNKSRDNWINLIYALGMDYVLDDICFGKVLRLMAGDVVFSHQATGGKLDPNTAVWNELPLPWEVFEGKASCNKAMVIDACKKSGIDAEKSGWVAPRTHGVATFKPTPELVNGVAIINPFLAKILKENKYFSGKKIKSDPLFNSSGENDGC